MWWGSKKAAAERAALTGEILAAIEGVAMYVRTVMKTHRAS